MLDDARAAMATYLGCARDDLVFVPNATTGINVVAKSLPLQAGDEVVGTDLEYGACERSWEWFCQQRGARYVKAHVPLPLTSPDEVVEAIFAAVTPRTRAIFLTHVTSGTALRLPVEAVARRAREAGILTVVDGAHAVGQWPVDLRGHRRRSLHQQLPQVALRAKGLRFSLCSPGPAAMAGVADRLLGLGGRERPSPATEPVRLPQPDPGHPRHSGVSRRPGGGGVSQESRDWETVRERCHALAVEARDRIAALSGLPQIAPVESRDGYRWFRQMAVAPLPAGIDGKALKRRLYDEYRVEAPVTSWDENGPSFGSRSRVTTRRAISRPW